MRAMHLVVKAEEAKKAAKIKANIKLHESHSQLARNNL